MLLRQLREMYGGFWGLSCTRDWKSGYFGLSCTDYVHCSLNESVTFVAKFVLLDLEDEVRCVCPDATRPIQRKPAYALTQQQIKLFKCQEDDLILCAGSDTVHEVSLHHAGILSVNGTQLRVCQLKVQTKLLEFPFQCASLMSWSIPDLFNQVSISMMEPCSCTFNKLNNNRKIIDRLFNNENPPLL